MMNVERAINYILVNGTSIEKARLKGILYSTEADGEIVDFLTQLQNPDGGFPYLQKKGNPSTISVTNFIFTWLYDLNLLNHQLTRSALKYIQKMQKEDGSWDENSDILRFGPPIWMRPGIRDSINYNTASSLFWIIILSPEKKDLIKKGYRYLVGFKKDDGGFGGFLHNTWLSVAVLGMVEGWDTTPVKKALNYLGNIQKDKWISSQITWMLWTLGLAGIPKESPLVNSMLSELTTRQQEDGSYISEDGRNYQVNTTIEALKVLKIFRN